MTMLELDSKNTFIYWFIIYFVSYFLIVSFIWYLWWLLFNVVDNASSAIFNIFKIIILRFHELKMFAALCHFVLEWSCICGLDTSIYHFIIYFFILIKLISIRKIHTSAKIIVNDVTVLYTCHSTQIFQKFSLAHRVNAFCTNRCNISRPLVRTCRYSTEYPLLIFVMFLIYRHIMNSIINLLLTLIGCLTFHLFQICSHRPFLLIVFKTNWLI